MEAQCEYLKAAEMLMTGRRLSLTVLVHVGTCIVYCVFVSGYECATQKHTHNDNDNNDGSDGVSVRGWF